MKHYNIDNYVRYKKDVEKTIKSIPHKEFYEYTQDELITTFLPLVENSFFSKRVKGGIRRAIDINRGSMRLPEHVTNELRKGFGKDKASVAAFFNSIFLSIDEGDRHEDDMFMQIEDKSEPYNQELLNMYLDSLLKMHLTDKEYHVLRLSYGLDCEKQSAKEIAKYLDIEGAGAYVRVSQLKKQAVTKLIENVDHSQVFEYL
jgi:DNA-directed RNA polymerase specialized sigma subunit